MMSSARSAAHNRRQTKGKGMQLASGANGQLIDFGSVVGGEGLQGEDRVSGGNAARFRQALMKAEELAIRRLRQAEVRHGGWPLRIFGVGKTFGGLPGSRLIHPSSPFASGLLIVSATLLLYSALASSFLVGFLWEAEICEFPPPTLLFDMFVDIFFLVEIFLQFFIGVYRNGEYCDRMSVVACTYAGRGGLFFDLGTSIPVSWVEYFIMQNCDQILAASDSGVNSNLLRIVRTSKALRIARLLRAFRIIARLKSIMSFVSFIGDYFRIPPYGDHSTSSLKLTYSCTFTYARLHAACAYIHTNKRKNKHEQISMCVNIYMHR